MVHNATMIKNSIINKFFILVKIFFIYLLLVSNSFAKDSNYFIYSNQYHKFVNLYKNSFQHGGISMEEIIVPLIKLKGKNGTV